MGSELNAQIYNVLQPTTTVIALFILGRIQLVLSLRPHTPVLWSRGGTRDINRIVQLHINEQAISTCVPDQRGTHVRFVGARADALGCIWLKYYLVLVDKNCTIYIYIYIYMRCAQAAPVSWISVTFPSQICWTTWFFCFYRVDS